MGFTFPNWFSAITQAQRQVSFDALLFEIRSNRATNIVLVDMEARYGIREPACAFETRTH